MKPSSKEIKKPIFFVERNGELIRKRYASVLAANMAASVWRKKYPKDKIEVKGYVEI